MDRATGSPWPGVDVHVRGRQYHAETDEKGRYVLPYFWQTRKIAVMFFAPTRTLDERLITTKEIVIDRGDVVTVDVVAYVSDFADPPLETIQGVFSGRFRDGFEESTFEPDDGRVQATDGGSREIRDAWVEFAEPLDVPPFDWETWYRVTWSGRLTGPARYGHMGCSEYLMEVDEVREWREDNDHTG